jgi:hypothetical protein
VATKTTAIEPKNTDNFEQLYRSIFSSQINMLNSESNLLLMIVPFIGSAYLASGKSIRPFYGWKLTVWLIAA